MYFVGRVQGQGGPCARPEAMVWQDLEAVGKVGPPSYDAFTPSKSSGYSSWSSGLLQVEPHVNGNF